MQLFAHCTMLDVSWSGVLKRYCRVSVPNVAHQLISFRQYPILPDEITSRLRFATPAMHSWAHAWLCQLVYNCRLLEGLALTDGEGTERFWSRLRSLIPTTRSSAVRHSYKHLKTSYISSRFTQRSRRIWLIDRKALNIASELRNDLGQWICNKLKNGVVKQGDGARSDLTECGESHQYLRNQWKAQKKAQMSRKSRECDLTKICL